MSKQDHWPVEYADQLIVGNPTSNVAVCCFWSSKDRLKRMLDPEHYVAIGNLYSRAGINSMLRNILAKPTIRYLVLTGKSLTDSDKALLNFFEHGVDDQWRIIGNGGQIDKDLPFKTLKDVRENVELVDLRGTRQFKENLRKAVKRLDVLPPFAKPRTFPKTPPTVQTFPSEFLGFVVRRQTILEAWCEILGTVMTFGHVSPTDYGLEQKEVLSLLSVIENPRPRLGKLPHWAPFNNKEIETYVRGFFRKKKSDEVTYNYGNRMQSYWHVDQIELLANGLKKSGHSRRAVVSLWDPVQDAGSPHPPCITTVQAVVRDGRLHLIAYIRSNDMFRAYPLNAAALAGLQARVAGQLEGVKIGPLTILSFSAHVYSDCWDACEQAMVEAAKLRKRFQQDPRGSFVFRLENGEFISDHYSPHGDLVQTFRTNKKETLIGYITPFASVVQHGIYLGKEINRLKSACGGSLHQTKTRGSVSPMRKNQNE